MDRLPYRSEPPCHVCAFGPVARSTEAGFSAARKCPWRIDATALMPLAGLGLLARRDGAWPEAALGRDGEVVVLWQS